MSEQVVTEVRPDDWTTQMEDGGEVYPFVEDENCNITGLGHQDEAEFAEAVNRYDDEAGMELVDDDRWTADHIGHRWVLLAEQSEDRLRGDRRCTVCMQPEGRCSTDHPEDPHNYEPLAATLPTSPAVVPDDDAAGGAS